MKHQGEYGFTYDSEAEEWARWAVSCLEHNSPRSWRERRDLARFANDVLDQHEAVTRPLRGQPQNTCETGQPTGWDTIALLCLQGAAIAIGATLVAGMVGWL